MLPHFFSNYNAGLKISPPQNKKVKQQQANTPLKNQQHQPLLPLKIKQFLFTEKKITPRTRRQPIPGRRPPSFLKLKSLGSKPTARNQPQPAVTILDGRNRSWGSQTPLQSSERKQREWHKYWASGWCFFFWCFCRPTVWHAAWQLGIQFFLLRLLDLRVKVLIHSKIDKLSASVLHIDLHAFLVFSPTWLLQTNSKHRLLHFIGCCRGPIIQISKRDVVNMPKVPNPISSTCSTCPHLPPSTPPKKKAKNRNTVDGRNPANHLGSIKPCKRWDKLPISTG